MSTARSLISFDLQYVFRCISNSMRIQNNFETGNIQKFLLVDAITTLVNCVLIVLLRFLNAPNVCYVRMYYVSMPSESIVFGVYCENV